jgi:hypothetical protein
VDGGRNLKIAGWIILTQMAKQSTTFEFK